MNGGTDRKVSCPRSHGLEMANWSPEEVRTALSSHSDLLSPDPELPWGSGSAVGGGGQNRTPTDIKPQNPMRHRAGSEKGWVGHRQKGPCKLGFEEYIGVQHVEPRAKGGPFMLGSSVDKGRGERQACGWTDQQGQWAPGGLGCWFPPEGCREPGSTTEGDRVLEHHTVTCGE